MNPSTQGVAHVIPFHADLIIAPDPLACATRDVHMAVADFSIAVQQATTVDACLTLARQAGALALCLQAVESGAQDKADRL